MSTFVLNRNYALQMPSSYVDIDREEMEYVDGGRLSTFWTGIALDAVLVTLLPVVFSLTKSAKIMKAAGKFTTAVANKMAGSVMSGINKLYRWVGIGAFDAACTSYYTSNFSKIIQCVIALSPGAIVANILDWCVDGKLNGTIG